jgi:hypothetical protein
LTICSLNNDDEHLHQRDRRKFVAIKLFLYFGPRGRFFLYFWAFEVIFRRVIA